MAHTHPLSQPSCSLRSRKARTEAGEPAPPQRIPQQGQLGAQMRLCVAAPPLRKEDEGKCRSRPSSFLLAPRSSSSRESHPAWTIHSLTASPPRGCLTMVGQPWLPALSIPPPLLRSLLDDFDLSIHFHHQFSPAPCILLSCGYEGSLLKS